MQNTFTVYMNIETRTLARVGGNEEYEYVTTTLSLPDDVLDSYISQMVDKMNATEEGTFEHLKSGLKLRWGTLARNYRSVPVEEVVQLNVKRYGLEGVTGTDFQDLFRYLYAQREGEFSEINQVIKYFLSDDSDVIDVYTYSGPEWESPGEVTYSVSEIAEKASTTAP